ncbi:MAG: metalloregulator ArsR/SmtB family transcription factor [Pseudomonadota bacterium]
MDDTSAAQSLAALGHEARLKLFRLLVRAGPNGLNIGEIGRVMAVPPSTLAHHLGTLVSAGLVIQEKRGREVINKADFSAMKGLLHYIEAECCAGVETASQSAA